MAQLLVIDDEECIRFTFENFLANKGHQVLCARDYDEALASMSEIECDLVFADILLGGKTGLDFLRTARERGVKCPVVMITGYPDIGTASEALRLGAFDYIPKPVERETLLRVTDTALQHKKVTDERDRYRSHLDAIFRSVGDMIVTVDDRLVVTGVNEAASKLCGYSPDVIGKDIRSLDLGCTRKCLEPLKETIEKKQSVKAYRLECRHAGDPTQVINVSTYPLMERPGAVSGAVMVVRDETRLVQLERDLGRRQRLHNMLGKSPRMQKVFSLIEALAGVDSTVLITGESGTGKELAAEAMHYLGPRRDRPFVKVNCSALSESLLESELFGHVKGAFTGAITARIGRFQIADGGSILVDEIGDLSPKVQSSLLRVLQKKEFERVGDSVPRKVNVRIISATNKNLREMVTLGEFREDLLYRLDVIEVNLPPLRERREDIPLLVDHFLQEFNKRMHKEIDAISSDVEGVFLKYAWPGNIRELEHALEHACVLCAQDVITIDHLPEHLRRAAPAGAVFQSGGRQGVDPQAIVKALEKTAGNKKKAARLLGIDRKTLYRNIAKYKIPDLA